MNLSARSRTAGNRIRLVIFSLAAISPWARSQVMPMQTMSTAWSQPGYPAPVPVTAAAMPVYRAVPAMPEHQPQARVTPASLLHFDGRTAWLMQLVPTPVYNVVLAANRLQGKPYKWGGGHRSYIDTGYDCSGSTSHVLMSAGLLDKPLMSGEFKSYGLPGPGRYITIYARSGHVFMDICGLRFDAGGTSDRDRSQRGIFWRPTSRSVEGWTVRHPAGY